MRAWSLLFIAMGPLSAGWSSAGDAEGVIGVLSIGGDEAGLRPWRETAAYLNRTLPGHRFAIEPYTIAELDQAVATGAVDFVITHPGHYVKLEHRYGTSRIATLIRRERASNESMYGAMIIVRADSAIMELSDLRDASFMGLSPDAFGGFRMAWRELARAGVDPFRDIERLSFSNTGQGPILDAVRNGVVDAGTLSSYVFEDLAQEGKIDPAHYRILNGRRVTDHAYPISTPLYPEWSVAKLRNTSEDVASAVSVALLSMPPTDVSNLHGWTVPVDYRPVHTLLQELQVSPYQEDDSVTWAKIVRYYWPWLLAFGLVLLITISLNFWIRRMMAARAAELDRSNRSLQAEIRAHKETESVLRESQRLFSTLVSNLPGMVYRSSDDASRTMLFISEGVKALTGYNNEELVGNRRLAYTHLIHPDDRERVREEIRSSIEEGRPFQLVYRIVTASGDERWVWEQGRSLGVSEHGNAVLEGYITDITALKHSEAALRSIVHGTASVVGDKFFQVLVRELAGVLRVRWAFVFELYAPGKMRAIALWGDDDGINREFDLKGTPAENVINSGLVYYARAMARLFPDDAWLQEHHVESYLAIPLFDFSGAAIGHLGVMHDGPMQEDLPARTLLQVFAARASAELERKRVEHDKYRLTNHLRLLLDATDEGIYGVDLEGRCTFINRAAARMIGYTPVNVLGKHMHNLIHHTRKGGVAYPVADSPITTAITSGIGARVEDELFWRRDGVSFPVGFATYPIRENGLITGAVVIFSDTSQRHEAEAQLRKHAAAVEQSTTAVMITDVNGNIEYVNPRFSQLSGYSARDVVGRNRDALRSEGLGIQYELSQRKLRDHGEWRGELQNRKKNGESYWVRQVISPVRSRDDQVTHYLILEEDITEQKRAEAQWVRAENLAERLGRILDQSFDEIYVINAQDLRYVQANKGALNNLGYSMEMLERMTPADLSPDYSMAGLMAELAPLRTSKLEHLVVQTEHRRSDGSLYPVELRIQYSELEETPLFLIIAQDITERKIAEQALRKSQASLAAAQRIAHLGNWDWDISQNKLYWSDEVYQMFAMDPDLFTPSFEAFIQRIHPEDQARVRSAIQASLDTGDRYELEYRILWPDGREHIIYSQGEVSYDFGGVPARMMGTVQDVTARKHAEERLNFLAFYDDLTTLPNRVLFYDRLRQALLEASRYQRIVAVMFMDLDRFKNINDSMGHEAGDMLLKAVAQRLNACVREGDTVARLGGDEFTVVLTEIDHVQDAAKVAQKILQSFQQSFVIQGHELFISASLGITIYPHDDEQIQSLLKNADTAMYHAKEHGRNNYQFYSSEMSATAYERLVLETSLRQALERDELQLYYQPQVSLANGKVLGVEALIRWRHPQLGLVLPYKFIPLAEETGLIVPITEWALREACRQLGAWQDAGLNSLRISVNISSHYFLQKNMLTTVEQVMAEFGLSTAQLELELTETAIMHNIDLAVVTLKKLKALGVRIALDDFGTGYSSLSYLKRFPIDVLKIDQSFIRDIPEDQSETALTSAIINLGHSLGVEIVAEGVENADQMDFLAGEGCDLMQGNYFCCAVPADALYELVKYGKNSYSPEKDVRARLN